MNCTKANDMTNPAQYFKLLSQALLRSEQTGSSTSTDSRARECDNSASFALSTITLNEFSELWTLANSNHVIMRALPVLRRALAKEDSRIVEWIDRAIEKEQV